MLGPDDVGHRVVIRRTVGAGGRLTDVLGLLVEADETGFTVRSRDGRTHTVPRSAVTAAKRVPPRPATRYEIAALERAAQATWPPMHTGELGEWVLRAAGGFSSRANSALPIGDPGMALPAAVDAVEAWYRARQIRPAMNVSVGGETLEPVLVERGWHALPLVLVEAAELHALPPEDTDGVRLRSEPSPELLFAVLGNKGGSHVAAGHVISAVDQLAFAEVRADDGTLLAMARGAIDPTGHWLNLSTIEVVESARRQGLARKVIAALAEWARAEGAERAFLQVVAVNEPAVALYRRLGFRTHHTYLTWRSGSTPR